MRRKDAAPGATGSDWPNLNSADIAADRHEPESDDLPRRDLPDGSSPASWIAAAARPDHVDAVRGSGARLGGVIAVADDARTGFTLSAKTTRLVVDGENLHDVFNSESGTRSSSSTSEELALARDPDRRAGRRAERSWSTTRSRASPAGRTVIVSGPHARARRRRGSPALDADDGRRTGRARAAGDVLTCHRPFDEGGRDPDVAAS